MALGVAMNLSGENTHATKHRIGIKEVSLAQEQANFLYSRQYHQVNCTVWVRQIVKCICLLYSHFPIYTGQNYNDENYVRKQIMFNKLID